MLTWPDSTVWDAFADIAERWSTRTAVVFEGEEWTFREVEASSRALAHGLADLGVDDGDLVATWLGNRPAFLQTLLAASSLGAAVVPMNTRYRSHEVEYMLSDAGCTAVVTEGELLGEHYVDLLAESVPALADAGETIEDDAFPALDHVVTVGDGAGYPAVEQFDDLLDAGAGRDELDRAGDAAAPAAVFYTSGTTSDPKGCLQSNRSLVNHSERVGEHLGVDEDDVALTTLPVYGIWGFNALLSGVLRGATVVMQTHFEPRRALTAFEDHDVTYASVLATQLFRMTDLDAFDPSSVESFRRATVAFTSSTFTEEKFRELERTFGLALVRAYGLSEGNSQVFVGDPEAPIEDRLRLGGPVCHPDEEARIVDPETGEECAEGESGEILLRGFNLFSGYLGNPEATDAAMEEGWFHTGDLGRRVGDREFVYESRLDDALRVRGFLVLPGDVESAIDEHPGVIQSQVVGVDHPTHGEVPVAFVKLDDPDVLADDLYGFLDGRVADYKVPEDVRFVDSFPRADGPHGDKIKKAELRDRVADAFSG